MKRLEKVPVWFFIGSLLILYGVIVTAASVYDVFHRGSAPSTVLENIHFGIWWGILMIGIGTVYFIIFRPSRLHS